MEAGASAKLVAHFHPFGSPLVPSGSAGRAAVPPRPGVIPFLDVGHQRGVTSWPRSLGFGGRVRLGLRGPRRTPDRAAPEARGPGLRPQSGEAGSEAKARGHRGVMRLPRGLCSAPRPHCAFPSSPSRSPPQACAPALFVFPAPAPSTQARKQPSGGVSGPRLWPEAGPSPTGASVASSRRAGRGVRGEGARGLSGVLGQGSAGLGRWPNGVPGLGSLPSPKSGALKGAGGLRRRPPHCSPAPGPLPQPGREWPRCASYLRPGP